MHKQWIYELSKEKLIDVLERHKLDSSGKLDALRKRLSEYATDHPETFTPETHRPTKHVASHDPSDSEDEERETMANPAKIMNQVRKWGVHFDGRDPLGFLERMDDLRRAYGYSGDVLLIGLAEILKGKALLWYRNNHEEWETWEEFSQAVRAQYLPHRYRARATREIQERRQGDGEEFRDFVTDMLTRMRRAGGYSKEDRLERLYENMHDEYKMYVDYDDIRDLDHLQHRIAALESAKQKQAQSKPRTPKPTVAATAYDRNECCWRCKQRGHTRFKCERPPKKFCSRCGKDGVLTRDCHPGNAGRDGEAITTGAAPSP